MYVNVIGGIKVVEPAVDLAIVAALMSSYKDVSLNPNMVFFGEVGLTGEIRSVGHVDKRISEAFRLGFDKCVLPVGNKKVAQNYMNNNEQNLYIMSSISELKELILK